MNHAVTITFQEHVLAGAKQHETRALNGIAAVAGGTFEMTALDGGKKLIVDATSLFQQNAQPE